MLKLSSWIIRAVNFGMVIGVAFGFGFAGVAYAQVPTLSQTSITIGVGQSLSVTSENGVGVYIGSNPGSTYVTAVANGTQIALTGIATGSATISVCGVGTASDCTNLSVTVQTGAVASTTTSTTTSSTTSATSGLTFSENNFSLAVGGTQTVSVTGGDGVYNITGNTNPSSVSIGMSAGGTFVVDGIASGSNSITICDTSNPNICGTLSVTAGTSVSNSTSTSSNQNIAFSATNPTVAAGQTLDVSISGGGATTYVVLSNQNSSVAQASMSGGSTLVISGETAGTDSVTICATGGGCSPFPFTVTGASSTTTTATTTSAPTTTTTATVTTQPTTSASVVANAALLAEIQNLQTAITQALTQMQSIQSQLNQLEAQVDAGSGAGMSTTGTATTYDFTETLTVGSEDAQVTALQQRLTQLGFYSGPVTGYFGSLTAAAVIKYQTAHGLAANGSIGPSTRADLNTGQ